MTLLRQKIDNELDALDSRSMAAVYEQLHQLNSMRRLPIKQRTVTQDIENVLRLTSSSKGSWSEAVVASREERL